MSRPASSTRTFVVPLLFLALLTAWWAGTAGQAQAQTPPSISSVSPPAGPAAGGTTVTIVGTGFVAGSHEDTQVTFNGVDGEVTSVTTTTVVVVAPAGSAGDVLIRVTNPNGESTTISGAFAYSGAAPTVTSVAPATGSTNGGTSVVIEGADFRSGATVRFGGTLATGVVVNSGTRITAVTPPHAAGAVMVEVTNADLQSGSRSNAFTYTPAPSPTVSGVSPNTGSTGGGTPVVISGTNFVSGATVRFGNSLATSVVVTSSTRITAVSPARSAGAVTVTVANPDGQSGSRANSFTYVTTPAPSVTSVSPSTGPLAGGVLVTITGRDFQPGAVAAFGGVNAQSTVYVSSTHLQAVTPPRSTTGNVAVRVTNTDGRSGSRSNAFTYANPTPTVTSVTPSGGTTAGGTNVTIIGTNFFAGTTVTFGGTSATDVIVVNSTTLLARTPARPAGTVDVRVRSASGQQATRSNAFTYRAPAVVTGISPNSGAASGGTLVTITGSGFTAGSTVTFGGVPATNVNVVNATRITARTPARSVGTVVVQVLSPEAVLATGTPTFTYTATPPAGQITAGTVPNSGLGLIRFSGGTNEQLTLAAIAQGCSTSRLSFFSTVGGRFVVFIPGTSIGVVNADWNARFPGGVPAETPLLVACR